MRFEYRTECSPSDPMIAHARLGGATGLAQRTFRSSRGIGQGGATDGGKRAKTKGKPRPGAMPKSPAADARCEIVGNGRMTESQQGKLGKQIRSWFCWHCRRVRPLLHCDRSLLLTGTHKFPDRRIIHHNFDWHRSFGCLELHRHASYFCNVQRVLRII